MTLFRVFTRKYKEGIKNGLPFGVIILEKIKVCVPFVPSHLRIIKLKTLEENVTL